MKKGSTTCLNCINVLRHCLYPALIYLHVCDQFLVILKTAAALFKGVYSIQKTFSFSSTSSVELSSCSFVQPVLSHERRMSARASHSYWEQVYIHTESKVSSGFQWLQMLSVRPKSFYKLSEHLYNEFLRSLIEKLLKNSKNKMAD